MRLALARRPSRRSPRAPAALLAFDDGSPGRLTAVRSPDGTTTATVQPGDPGAPVT